MGLLLPYVLMAIIWIFTRSKIRWNLIDLFGVLFAALTPCLIRIYVLPFVFRNQFEVIDFDRFNYWMISLVINTFLLGLVSCFLQLLKFTRFSKINHISLIYFSILMFLALTLAIFFPPLVLELE